MFRATLALFLALAMLVASPSLLAHAATVKTPTASGKTVYNESVAVIDASNTSQGYIMVKYTGKAKKVKLRITKDTTYTYDLSTAGNYETFPLTEGDGNYTVDVFEHIKDNQYATAVHQTIAVALADEFLPFLYPNQFCNYNEDSKVVNLSDEVVGEIQDTLEKVAAIYNYTVENLSYDYEKAGSVQSGYLPDNDSTIDSKTGICFDYASLMVAMLRLQEIPAKLVIGYTMDIYHAWVNVYTVEQGWVDGIIQFNGKEWRFMDTTNASTGKGNEEITNFIKNPANYIAKFSY